MYSLLHCYIITKYLSFCALLIEIIFISDSLNSIYSFTVMKTRFVDVFRLKEVASFKEFDCFALTYRNICNIFNICL